MGKFGGFGGAFKSSGIANKISGAAKSAEKAISNVSPEQMNKIMEKATIGNAASWAGGKIGLNIDAGKIDGVVNKYTETRTVISNRLLNMVLGSAEQLGYKISLPDGEKIANYMMQNGIIDKIEGFPDKIEKDSVQNLMKNIDIPKVANEVGASITKIPKVQTEADVKMTFGEKAEFAKSTMSGIGNVLGEGIDGIKTDVSTSFNDVKEIVKGE